MALDSTESPEPFARRAADSLKSASSPPVVYAAMLAETPTALQRKARRHQAARKLALVPSTPDDFPELPPRDVPPTPAAAAPRVSVERPAVDASTPVGWIRACVRAEGVTAAVAAGTAVLCLAGVVLMFAPDRVIAPGTTQRMVASARAVHDAEQLAMTEKETFVDPAPFFRRQAAAAGITDANVLYSYADANHWILKVRYAGARTVCLQMVTLMDEHVPRPNCRPETDADVAAAGKP